MCREEGVQTYKVLGSCELIGLRAAMEEDEVDTGQVAGVGPCPHDVGRVRDLGRATAEDDHQPHAVICWREEGEGGWWLVDGGQRTEEEDPRVNMVSGT
jgi:hypothetical protein